MYDHEIKDIMRRSTTPDLSVTLSFLEGSRQLLAFPSGDQSRPFHLIARIENSSPQPAFHVVVDIGIDADFEIASYGGFQKFTSKETVDSTPLTWMRWDMSSPPGQPIFKEYPMLVTEKIPMLALPHSALTNYEVHDLTVRVVAPGFTRQENWSITRLGLD